MKAGHDSGRLSKKSLRIYAVFGMGRHGALFEPLPGWLFQELNSASACLLLAFSSGPLLPGNGDPECGPQRPGYHEEDDRGPTCPLPEASTLLPYGPCSRSHAAPTTNLGAGGRMVAHDAVGGGEVDAVVLCVVSGVVLNAWCVI